jgi:hypothetical protein
VTVPPPVMIGGIVVTRNPSPVIVSSSQTSVLSDGSGLAILPAIGEIPGALLVQGAASAGISVLSFQLQALLPEEPSTTGSLQPPLEGPPKIHREAPDSGQGRVRMRQRPAEQM